MKMHTSSCLNMLKRLRQQILGQLPLAFALVMMESPYSRGFSFLLRP